MTYWQEGYADGADAARGNCYRVAPGRQCSEYKRGWRAGYDDERLIMGRAVTLNANGTITVR